MSVASAKTEHSAEWQQKEQGDEHKVPAGDQDTSAANSSP
jgi:hypothetical protein